MTNSSERSVWATRLGFILASAGSAVGLGAIWKFPYMAGTNGGSAFILPYIVLTIAIGFVVLMIEMALGRASRGGAAHALRLFGGRFWGGVGKISVLTGFLILAQLPLGCVFRQWPNHRHRSAWRVFQQLCLR